MIPSPHKIVAVLVSLAALLSLVMAFAGGINRDPAQWRGPPDEHGHRGAARYYVDHWLPPKVGDAATLDSYSRDYGYSYLNDSDPAYPLAGKFAALISPVIGDVDRGFRLFNVSLLALLAYICYRRPTAWPVFVPLLLSPQPWYIFSYFNGDALPLFLAIMVAYQIVVPDSHFNRYLDAPGMLQGFQGALVLGLLLALLLLCKRNYLTFVAFAPVLLAIFRFGPGAAALLAVSAVGTAAILLGWLKVGIEDAHLMAAGAALALLGVIFGPRSTRNARGRVFGKLLALGVVAVGLAIPRYAWDVMNHGSLEEKSAAMGALQEQIAKPGYKPSEIYGTQPKEGVVFHGIEMRARGVPLEALFAPPWNWHLGTFKSSTGQYGWLDILAPTGYYVAMAVAYALLFVAYVAAALRSRSAMAACTLLAATAFSALTVAISVHHSWNNDFQAQGRYLFPIVAMLGAGLVSVRDALRTRIFMAAVGVCFLLSAWSFVWVGLRQIPKAF